MKVIGRRLIGSQSRVGRLVVALSLNDFRVDYSL